LLAAALAGCAKTNREGELPLLQVGNEWTYQVRKGEFTICTISMEVAGEAVVDGESCWVIEMSRYPPAAVQDYTMHLDKSNLEPIQLHMSVKEQMLFGIDCEFTDNYSYDFPDGLLWPLEVDKQVKKIEHVTSVEIWNDETETEIKTRTSTYQVEAIEEITVAAGKFMCFKIVEYDDAGAERFTQWYSDKVRRFVKRIDHTKPETMELKSYSLRVSVPAWLANLSAGSKIDSI
jgi:hypothetical protein